MNPPTGKPRTVARLDIKGPNVIKGVQFEGLRIVGEPQSLAETYYKDGVQEILLIDTVASLYGRNHLSSLIRNLVQHIFVPLTVGGGIRSIADAKEVLAAGADKVAVNTEALQRPELLRELANEFGSQSVVISIQATKEAGHWEALSEGGRERSGRDVLDWLGEAIDLGAGEALITSVDRDGTGQGFDYPLAAAVDATSTIPWIMSGGCGNLAHVEELLSVARPEAISVGRAAHLGKITIGELLAFLDLRAVSR